MRGEAFRRKKHANAQNLAPAAAPSMQDAEKDSGKGRILLPAFKPRRHSRLYLLGPPPVKTFRQEESDRL